MFFFFLFRLNFKLLSVGSTATGLRGEYGGGRLDLLSRSGVPSRSPGLQMTGVSRRNRPRGLLLSPLAPALEFQRSFRATGSSPLPGKIRTFRARSFCRRILVSRAWHRGSGSEHDDPRGERDDGRQRGPRGRRGPKRAPSLVTFSETLRIFGLCNPVRLPRTQSSPPGWLAGCCLLSRP